MPNNKTSLAFASTIAAGLLALIGCAAEATDSAPQGVEQANVGPKVAFTESYSEKGTITVYEDEAGNLSLGITGALGVDDQQKADQAMGKANLVETYRALKGDDVEVPTGLLDLSERYAKQIEAARAEAMAARRTQSAQASVELQAADGLTKDFYSENCVTYHEYMATYKAIFCQLATCPNGYRGTCWAGPTSDFMDSSDRSYAYNGTSVNATHYLVGYASTTAQSIPPSTWNIAQWNFTGFRRPGITNTSSSGTLWATVHDYEGVVL